jgi:bifunctional UDP-N-acetylglucosamine pyrophosphorylase/glucosamine-1-phosphate N-acetyltransferase
VSFRRSVCAVIPAAGRGSRLGLDVPKILAPLARGLTVWDMLRATIEDSVDHIHVVLSPAAVEPFLRYLGIIKKSGTDISYSVQPQPLGMGDAIFCGMNAWQSFADILIIWGDQVFVSRETVNKAINLHRKAPPPSLTLPLFSQRDAYVDYVIERGRIVRVLQTSEGDTCRTHGMADAGVFVLSTANLAEKWRLYSGTEKGRRTGELNFLPFLAYLSNTCLWNTQYFEIGDARECRGINTPEDLAFFRKLLASRKKTMSKKNFQ